MEQYGIRFSVPFVAAKHRPRFTRSGHAYIDPKDTYAMEDIAESFMREAERAGFKDYFPLPADTEVTIFISVFKSLPKRTPKHVTSIPHTQKPDVDNIAKLVLDALNYAAYEDDRQVTQLHVSKVEREKEQETGMVVSLKWQK